MSDNTLFNISGGGSEEDGMYTKLNERSELERFRNQYSDEELERFVEEYESLWRGFFEENMRQEYPLHPWKILKQAREQYAEEENDGDWPSMPKRHALRVVKDEFAEKWRDYSREFAESEHS